MEKYISTLETILKDLKASDLSAKSKTDDKFFYSILNGLMYQKDINEVVYIFTHLIKGHYLTNGNKRLATLFLMNFYDFTAVNDEDLLVNVNYWASLTNLNQIISEVENFVSGLPSNDTKTAYKDNVANKLKLM